MRQLSFSDLELEQSRKPSRVSIKLQKIDSIVDWGKVLELVQVVDKTNAIVGGAPHRNLLTKVKMLFLQHLYNLSDPELLFAKGIKSFFFIDRSSIIKTSKSEEFTLHKHLHNQRQHPLMFFKKSLIIWFIGY